MEIESNLDPLPDDDKNHRHGLPMTDEEKAAIIAFLKTLSDKDFLTNPLLAEQ